MRWPTTLSSIITNEIYVPMMQYSQFFSSILHEKYDKVARESIRSRCTARFVQELALPPSVWLCVCDRNDIACCEAELFGQRCFIVI